MTVNGFGKEKECASTEQNKIKEGFTSDNPNWPEHLKWILTIITFSFLSSGTKNVIF